MKYVPGLMVGQLSGKAGNTVASRNRAGSYIRTRVIPKLVRNSTTTFVRTIFTDLSQAFRTLTQEQIKGWNNLGSQIVRKTSLGESFHLTGLQAYKSLNQTNQFLGNPVLADPPVFSSAPGADTTGAIIAHDATILSTTVVAGAASATQNVTSTAGVVEGDLFNDTTAVVSARVLTVVDATHVILDAVITTVTADTVDFVRDSDLRISFDPSPMPAGQVLMMFFTPPLSAGISRPGKSQFRFLTAIYPGATTNRNESLAYATQFGPIPSGTKVFARFFYVTTEGFAGSPFEFVVPQA